MGTHVRNWVVAVAGSALVIAPGVSAQPVDESGRRSVREIVRQSPVDATVDTVFTPITPCRIIDTRIFGGPIAGGTVRSFHVAGSGGGGPISVFALQGGVACGIPLDAVAASINLTVVPVSFPGDIRIAPVGVDVPLASIANWANLDVVPNAVDARIGGGAGPHLQVQADGGTTDLVADVYGYFREVGCQAGTVKALGQCWETSLRPTANLFTASEICSSAGLPGGGRLGSPLQLRALAGTLTLAAPPGEWTDSVHSNPSAVAFTVADDGGLEVHGTLSGHPYRCVFNPMP